jgi:hypothetical protein
MDLQEKSKQTPHKSSNFSAIYYIYGIYTL